MFWKIEEPASLTSSQQGKKMLAKKSEKEGMNSGREKDGAVGEKGFIYSSKTLSAGLLVKSTCDRVTGGKQMQLHTNPRGSKTKGGRRGGVHTPPELRNGQGPGLPGGEGTHGTAEEQVSESRSAN